MTCEDQLKNNYISSANLHLFLLNLIERCTRYQWLANFKPFSCFRGLC